MSRYENNLSGIETDQRRNSADSIIRGADKPAQNFGSDGGESESEWLDEVEQRQREADLERGTENEPYSHSEAAARQMEQIEQ